MTKSFKTAALVVLGITALLYWKEYNTRNMREQSYKEYQQKEEKEKADKENAYQENISKIEEKAIAVNACLAKHKAVKTETLEKETDVLIDYISFISQKNKDSVTRASNDKQALENLITPANTVVLYFNEEGEQDLNIKEHMYSYAHPEELNSTNKNRYKYNFKQLVQHDKNYIDWFVEAKYLAIVNTTKIFEPKTSGTESFESGMAISKVNVYNLENNKELKERTVAAMNSSSVRTFGNRGVSYGLLKSDLWSNLRKEVRLALFGIKFDLN